MAQSAKQTNLTPATKLMCATAFRSILKHLSPECPFVQTELPSDKAGVFITWTVPRPRTQSYILRGCIGTLSPASLDTAIHRYANLAAFNDPRFDPILTRELPALKVGVSILSGFEKADHVYDWQVGVHGLILEFGESFSATYLPEVCEEQGWSKEVCIQSLAEKAGFRGAFSGAILETAVLTRYQSTKAEMVYEEFLSVYG